MGFYRGPSIIREGLAVMLDAASTKSYPGSGTIWYNLGSAKGSVSQGGPFLPSWTTLGGVTCFNFNQTGAYFGSDNVFPSLFPTDRANLTVSAWIYPSTSELTSGDRGNIIKASNPGNAWYMSWNKSNQKLSNYWYGKSSEGYHESGAAMTRGTWNNVVAVWNPFSLSQFLNGNKTTASTSGVSANQTNGLLIGWEADSRQYSGGIAAIHIYDRALSDAEVIQNYNALKNRFGL
jgi:hypothetical protein